MKRPSFLLFAAAALLPCLLSAQLPKMHPDYPTVREELVTPILAMKSGVQESAAIVPWRLYVPEEASAGKKLPLVVALHGAGSRGVDNVRPMALFKSFWTPDVQQKHPAFILAPQMKREWVVKPGGFTNYNADDVPTSKEMQAMLELVERTIKEQPIDPDRVYVIGMSMGGYGTWDAITRRLDLWAAAVPICGGGDPGKAASFKHISIWAWHGSKDTTVPVENTRAIIEALKQAGASPKYTEIPVGHSSWNDAFKEPELYDWLFSQKRSGN